MTAREPRLSAVLCVRNEQQMLPDCLASLAFCDEIVVVLDRSTDRSQAIAEAAGAVILSGAWPVEGARRAAGLAAAAGDWVLEIDADERVPPALAAEIRSVIAASPYTFHKITIDNYVGGRLVRHGWGASFGVVRAARLYRRSGKRWGDQRVHPHVHFDGPEGPVLTHHLTHLVDEDLSDMLARLNGYTSLRAADLRDGWQARGARITNGKRESLGRNLGRFFARFYKCYVRRQGWREGTMGFAIALFAGLYPLIAYLKAVTICDDSEGGRDGAGPD